MSSPVRKSSFPAAVGNAPRILLLGSLPGDESLRRQQYYAHPRNAFWPIMEVLFGISQTLPYSERLAALNASRIALWDVVGSACRRGSLDTAIQAIEPNDIPGLLLAFPSIEKIGCNGGASFRFLKRCFPELAPRATQLPSTSPAAAVFSFEQKLHAYREFLVIQS